MVGVGFRRFPQEVVKGHADMCQNCASGRHDPSASAAAPVSALALQDRPGDVRLVDDEGEQRAITPAAQEQVALDVDAGIGQGDSYGKELDLAAAYSVGKWLGKVEYARFQEDDVLTGAGANARKRDTEKVWLTVMYTF